MTPIITPIQLTTAGLGAAGPVIAAGMVVAQVASPPGVTPWLQYGALGLCGMMVLMNWLSQRDLVKTIHLREKEKDAQAEAFVEQGRLFTETMRHLSEGLKDRKCLLDDERIQDILAGRGPDI